MESDAPDVLRDQILILSNYFHPEPTGSAPPVSDLALWLAEQGLGPAVLTARPSYPRNAVYPGYEAGQHDREEWNGVSVRRVASIVPASRGILARLVGEASFVIAALAARRRAYRAVLCVCPSVFVVLAAPLFRRRGGRVVALVHDIQSGLATGLQFGAGMFVISALRWLEAWSLNRCDTAIVLSDAMVEELRRIGVRIPLVVIPPQVDVSEIVPESEPSGPPQVVYSGNLGRKQGLDQVLALAAELKRRANPVRVLIRGEGSERPALEAQVRDEALTNVTITDLAPRSQISAAFGAAHVHLIPQAPQGANFALPSKIFSVMAASRAFVATAVVGTPLEVLTQRSGGGVCIAPDNPMMFADTVERLLVDQPLRTALGRSGRSFVETEIDRQVVCRRILQTFLTNPHPAG